MSKCLRARVGRVRRPLLLAALLAGLLAGLGLTGYEVGRSLWARQHWQEARRALDRRDFAGAEAHLAVCLQVWPRDPATHLLAARAARRAGHYEEAERQLASCRQLHGGGDGYQMERALLCVQQGDLGTADAYLRATVGPDHPDAPLVLEALCQGYLKTDRLADAFEATELWLRCQPGSAEAHYWRGWIEERLRRMREAAADYRKALELQPGRDDARLRLGDLLLAERQPDEAVGQFEQVRLHDPDNPAALRGLARGRWALGQGDEARELLDRVLARHPDDEDALRERGRLALETGRPAEAEGLLRRAVSLAADDREAGYSFALCLRQVGKAKEAREQEARVQQLAADLARLNRLIADVGTAPRNAALRREAGLICLKYGRKADALHWLLSALDADPNDAPTRETLANYFAPKGDRPGGPADQGPPAIP